MIDANCIAVAAHAYGVQPSAIDQVLAVHDGGMGAMGVPSGWLPILKRAGFDTGRLASDRCYNIAAGAWILRLLTDMKPHAVSGSRTATVAGPAVFQAKSEGACTRAAAKRYHIPFLLLTAILVTEGGRVGAIKHNVNGSYDMGPAQVNSTWLPVLEHAGISRDAVINDACVNISVGAWILASALDGETPRDPAAFWRRVGDYNSHTPLYNRIYQGKVWKNLQRIAQSQTPSP